jgi:hypothetical protein
VAANSPIKKNMQCLFLLDQAKYCVSRFFIPKASASTKLLLHARQFRVISKARAKNGFIFLYDAHLVFFILFCAATKHLSDVHEIFGFLLCFT